MVVAAATAGVLYCSCFFNLVFVIQVRKMATKMLDILLLFCAYA